LIKLGIGGTSYREPLGYSTSFSKRHFGGAQTVGQLLPSLLLILHRAFPCTAACVRAGASPRSGHKSDERLALV
jgi:hypothetical protein